MSNLFVLKDVGPEWEIERPASVADLVAALQEEGVGEVVEPHWDSFGRAWLPFSGPSTGRYLVVRIDGETP